MMDLSTYNSIYAERYAYLVQQYLSWIYGIKPVYYHDCMLFSESMVLTLQIMHVEIMVISNLNDLQ